jgi:hypothetical protein
VRVAAAAEDAAPEVAADVAPVVDAVEGDAPAGDAEQKD